MPWIIINNSQLEAFVLQDQWTNIEKKKTIFNQLKLIGFWERLQFINVSNK